VRFSKKETTLDYLYPGDLHAQVPRLTSILRAIYGGNLARAEIAEILAALGRRPTIPLISAIISMADQGDLRFAERAYQRKLREDLSARQARAAAARVFGHAPWYVSHRKVIAIVGGLAAAAALILSVLTIH
jgi:hypothetical protein